MDEYKEIFDPSYSIGMEKDAEKMKRVLKQYFPGLENAEEGVMFISLHIVHELSLSKRTLFHPGIT